MAWSRFEALLARHWAALRYVLTILIPALLRSGRRPVIFSRFMGMGDIICTIPASLELKKRHPGARFIYNCHPDFVTIPRLARVADRITSFEDIGVVGYWYRFLLAGFYNFAHGDDTPNTVAREPMVTEFCRQFGVAVTDQHPALAASPTVTERMRAFLAERNLDPESLILIHPGPSWPVKEWPHEKWATLVSGLNAHGHTSIAQLGVARYMNFGQVSVNSIPQTTSLVNELTVEECVAVIAMARLFVGIDSGLLHIAASTRTPSIGLFGPTDPQFFYPATFRQHFVASDVDCAGCQHRLPRLHWVTNCPYAIKCMKTLPVEPTLQAGLSKIGSAPLP